MVSKQFRIVYCTPALYFAGGMERVLTMKANYFAEHFGYDVTIILTDGKEKPIFYPLSDKVKVINLNIGFEELWACSFLKKIFFYLKKQYLYKKLLNRELMRIRPDITVSMLRREINFINDIQDGSKKIGEIHINRANFRNFEGNNAMKNLFSKFWMNSLLSKLQRLDRFVVLTEKDKEAWVELNNVCVIPNPLSFTSTRHSDLSEKRIIAVGRYCHEKGYDLLLKAWGIVQNRTTDWRLEIFGEGDRTQYEEMMTGRSSLYKNAVDKFLSYPLWGDGHALFYPDGTIWYSHNMVLDAFMGLGLFGGILFVIVLGFAIWNSYQMIHTHREYSWIGVLCICHIISHMFSGSFYHADTLNTLFAILLSM